MAFTQNIFSFGKTIKQNLDKVTDGFWVFTATYAYKTLNLSQRLDCMQHCKRIFKNNGAIHICDGFCAYACTLHGTESESFLSESIYPKATQDRPSCKGN